MKDIGKKPTPNLDRASSSAPRERKRCLDLRARVVLDDAGTRFFNAKSAALQRFEAPEGESRYGFRLRSVDVPWLKRLLLAGFVEKAEFPVRDVASVKDDLGDLSRLVVFSMLYGRFRSAAVARSMESEVIRRWNRAHPHLAMDAKNATSPAELREALASRSDAVADLKRELLSPVLRSIAVDGRKGREDKVRLSRFARELVDKLDPICLFVLLGSTADGRRSIESDLRKEIEACLDKADLADYLTLMVLELMGAAERSSLVDLLGPGATPAEIRSRLEDPASRRELIARLPNGLGAAMVWSLSKRWSLGRWRYRLRLGLHDGSASFEDSKRLFEERGRLSVGDRSLKEFYDGGTGPYGDDGLGWYYLSFLADACQGMGVGFEASVRERLNKFGIATGTASVNLVFVF